MLKSHNTNLVHQIQITFRFNSIAIDWMIDVLDCYLQRFVTQGVSLVVGIPLFGRYLIDYCFFLKGLSGLDIYPFSVTDLVNRLELIAHQDVIHIEGLRISFEISKSIDSKPNPARISLWNLNRNIINRPLASTIKRINLYVGSSSLRIVDIRDLIRTKVMRDGVDFIIEFECGDGFNDHQSAIFSKTIRAGATIKDVFLNAVSTFESQLGSHMLPSNIQLPRAQVFNVPTRTVLNDLANDQNANWFIEDGELNFLPYDHVMNKSMPLLSEQTGLIDSPEQTDQGLEIDCLLNPD